MPVEGGGGTLFIKRAISSKGGGAMRGRGDSSHCSSFSERCS